jgi:hypothetical protein
MTAVLTTVFLLLLILGAPIAFGIGLSSLLPGLINPAFAGSAVFVLRGIISGANSTPLLALPCSSFPARSCPSAAYLTVYSTSLLISWADEPAACPVPWSSPACSTARSPVPDPPLPRQSGGMGIPLMISLGYEPAFAAALVAAAGGLGTIIPPSIPFINYGVITGTSVGELFIAGILPGILVALCLCAYAVFYCVRHGEDKKKIAANCDQLRQKGILKVLKESFWALLTPVIILGSIYGGICTPTEAAAFSVIYATIGVAVDLQGGYTQRPDSDVSQFRAFIRATLPAAGGLLLLQPHTAVAECAHIAFELHRYAFRQQIHLFAGMQYSLPVSWHVHRRRSRAADPGAHCPACGGDHGHRPCALRRHDGR